MDNLPLVFLRQRSASVILMRRLTPIALLLALTARSGSETVPPPPCPQTVPLDLPDDATTRRP